MNHLAVELSKRVEWGYSTTQIWRLLAICVRVYAGLNSRWGHVVLPAPVCHLSVISSCISDVFFKRPLWVCVCVCVWSLHFRCIHNSSFSCCWYKTVGVCFVSHWLVNFLMCLFSLGALPCQTVWRGELLGEFKRPRGLQRKVLGKY